MKFHMLIKKKHVLYKDRLSTYPHVMYSNVMHSELRCRIKALCLYQTKLKTKMQSFTGKSNLGSSYNWEKFCQNCL